jgi:hypothetical protein
MPFSFPSTNLEVGLIYEAWIWNGSAWDFYVEAIGGVAIESGQTTTTTTTAQTTTTTTAAQTTTTTSTTSTTSTTTAAPTTTTTTAAQTTTSTSTSTTTTTTASGSVPNPDGLLYYMDALNAPNSPVNGSTWPNQAPASGGNFSFLGTFVKTISGGGYLTNSSASANMASRTGATSEMTGITGDNSRTVSIWFRTSSSTAPANGTLQLLLSYGTPSSGRARIWEIGVKGSTDPIAKTNLDTTSQGLTLLGSDAPFTKGQWTNITYTYTSLSPSTANSGNLSTYLNGALFSTENFVSGFITTNGGNFAIIGRTETDPYAANIQRLVGDIAIVRVWSSRALTSAEVASEYSYFSPRFTTTTTTSTTTTTAAPTTTTTTTTAAPGMADTSITRIDYPGIDFESISGSIIDVIAILDDPASGDWSDAGIVWSNSQTRPAYPTNHTSAIYDAESGLTTVNVSSIPVNSPLYWWAYDRPNNIPQRRYSEIKNWAWYGTPGASGKPPTFVQSGAVDYLTLIGPGSNNIEVSVNGYLLSGPIADTNGYITGISVIWSLTTTPDANDPATYDPTAYVCTPVSQGGTTTILAGNAVFGNLDSTAGASARLVVTYSSGLVAQSNVVQIGGLFGG